MTYPKHDFHVHTNYSDGVAPPVRMIESAAEKELKAIAITDHGPEISVGMSQSQIEPMIADVEYLKADAEIPVFVGVEANIIDHAGSLDIDDDVISKLDVLVAGVHHLNSLGTSSEIIARDYLETVINSMRSQRMDILVHPFWYREDLSAHLPREDLEIFAEVAAEQGIAIELNRKHRAPSKEVLSICDEKGTSFSFGTDAHAPQDVGEVGWAANMLEEVGASQDSLIIDKFI